MMLIYRSFEPPCAFQPLFPKQMRKSRDQANVSAGAFAAKLWSLPCFLSCFSATLVNQHTWRTSGPTLHQTPLHRGSCPPERCPWHYCSSVLPPDQTRCCAGGCGLCTIYSPCGLMSLPPGGWACGGRCHGGDCLPIFLPAGQACVCVVKHSLTFLSC